MAGPETCLVLCLRRPGQWKRCRGARALIELPSLGANAAAPVSSPAGADVGARAACTGCVYVAIGTHQLRPRHPVGIVLCWRLPRRSCPIDGAVRGAAVTAWGHPHPARFSPCSQVEQRQASMDIFGMAASFWAPRTLVAVAVYPATESAAIILFCAMADPAERACEGGERQNRRRPPPPPCLRTFRRSRPPAPWFGGRPGLLGVGTSERLPSLRCAASGSLDLPARPQKNIGSRTGNP